MDITLTPEQDQLVEDLVAQGRFSSPSDVVAASLTLIQAEEDWRTYAKEHIDAGVEAASANDFATDADMNALFSRYQRKSASGCTDSSRQPTGISLRPRVSLLQQPVGGGSFPHQP